MVVVRVLQMGDALGVTRSGHDHRRGPERRGNVCRKECPLGVRSDLPSGVFSRFIFFICLFVAALRLRDNSIVDIGWVWAS